MHLQMTNVSLLFQRNLDLIPLIVTGLSSQSHTTICITSSVFIRHDGIFDSSRAPLVTAAGKNNYIDVIIGAIASQITSLAIVYSTVYSGTDKKKHWSSASLAFVPVNSRHKWPATRRSFHLMTSCERLLGSAVMAPHHPILQQQR